MAKTIKTAMQYRSMEYERGDIDDEKRTVALSFSSEAEVERYFGNEILDHSPEAVDLSRLNSGGAVLVNHDDRDQVGVVESARVDGDRKARAVVRFSKSARAEEIFQDVKDGIRRLVSVGYRVNKLVTDKVEKGKETLRAVSWTPLEVSFVSVPADTSVGVGRSESKEFETEIETMKRILLDPAAAEGGTATPPAKPVNIEEQRNAGVTTERQRQREIRAIAERLKGRVENIEDLAGKAIDDGIAVSDFRAQAMESLPKMAPVSPMKPLDIKPKEWQRYSIARAIRSFIPGEGERFDGLEREVSDEVSLQTGRRAEGFWLPREALAYDKRNFVGGTGTLGGMLIDTENLGSQFVELLRNRMLTAQLGARILNLTTPVTIPRQNAAGAVNWVAETVAATLSTGNFVQFTLTPQGLSAFQQYSKALLFQSDPSIDSLIRNDIITSLALEIDRVVFHGTGSGQPRGITATTGVTTIALGANGAAFSVANGRASMVSLETAVATNNADIGNMAYVTNAAMRGRLKMIDESLATNVARWVWQGGKDGEVNGYAAHATNQVSAIQTQGTATTICSSVFFGDWSNVLVGQFNNGATDMVIDPYVLAANAVVRVIARHWVDLGIRQPGGFSVLLGCLNS